MKNTLSYSTYIENESDSKIKKETDTEKFNNYHKLVNDYVLKNGYIELNCPYYGRDNYYYNKNTKTMYKVDSDSIWKTDINTIFEISYDETVLRYNSLI